MTEKHRRKSRRAFLKTAGGAAVGAAAFPQIVSAGVLNVGGKLGANETIVTGHIGVGGRGGGLMGGILGHARSGITKVAAVCDVDARRCEGARKRVGEGATSYHDYRALLERKDLDAVVIATPDHWHAVNVVHAAESGKHIYCEKPAHCTIEEGKAMRAACHKAKVAVQIGSQGRSQPECHAAYQYIANGMIGKVRKVVCWHYPSPSDNRPVPDCDPPAGFDWDMWLGPLAWRPYNPRYHHGVFRWIMESGGGQIRDRGAHVMSNALMIMESDHTGPATIEATGTLPKKGLWNTGIEMNVSYKFKNPDWELVWAQPGEKIPYFDREKAKARRIRDGYGATYHGDKDKLIVWVGDGQVFTEKKAVDYELPAGGKEVYKSPGHFEDWFKGIKTDQKTIMNIDAGVATANLCVLGNLSLITRRKLHWDPVKREIVGDEQARRLMGRPQRYPYHL